MKQLIIFFCIAIFLLSNACTARNNADTNTANIAITANAYAAGFALQDQFEAQTEYRLNLTSGSTGQLYAQIKNGAPFDIFLSADQARPALLIASGEAMPASQFTYGIGQLVLWGGPAMKTSGATTPAMSPP